MTCEREKLMEELRNIGPVVEGNYIKTKKILDRLDELDRLESAE